MEGCTLVRDQIWDDGDDHKHLDMVATYDDHKVFAFYPKGAGWADNQEFAFDVLLDDYHNGHDFRNMILDKHANVQIGLACDCDSNFGSFCIIELGTNVESNHAEFERQEFRLQGDKNCPTGSNTGFCGETYRASYSWEATNRPWQRGTGDADVRDLAYDTYNRINIYRADDDGPNCVKD